MYAIKPDIFSIKLDREIYFPGERVKGILNLTTSSPIQCRGVRVHSEGKSRCYFTSGSGNSKYDHEHTQFYSNCKRTLFGNINKTPVIRNVSEFKNVMFGPPWTPDEGIMYINQPVNHRGRSLIVRVMKYLWMQTDEVLGEVLLDVAQLVDSGETNINLTKDGRDMISNIEFTMNWEEDNEIPDLSGVAQRCLRLRILGVYALAGVSWLSSRDIYVQAYWLPDGQTATPGEILPAPVSLVEIPPGEYSFPFAFDLPNDLPSSFIHGPNYIVYSIYAHIDIAWKIDPSTRCFFTVVQPLPAYMNMLPCKSVIDEPLYQQCCLPPFCCYSFSLSKMGSVGSLFMELSTDRGSFAPGETLTLGYAVKAKCTNQSFKVVSCHVRLQQIVKLWSNGMIRHRVLDVVSEELRLDSQVARLRIPLVSPSFPGGIGKNISHQVIKETFGHRWFRHEYDPVVWEYKLVLSVLAELPGLSFTPREFSVFVPLTIGAIGLALLPPSTVVPSRQVSVIVRVDSDLSVDEKCGDIDHIVPVLYEWRTDTRIRDVLPKLRMCEVGASVYGSITVQRSKDWNSSSDLSFSPQFFINPDMTEMVSLKDDDN